MQSRDHSFRLVNLLCGFRGNEDGHRVGFGDGIWGLADQGEKTPKLLVGERHLPVVEGDEVARVVESVRVERDDLDVVLGADQLHDLVVLHRLATHLRGLEGELCGVPFLEELRKEDSGLANQHVQPGAVRLLLQAAVQVVKSLQQKPPDVHSRPLPVVGVEPGVDDEDGFEALATHDGIGERRVVVQAEGIESKPVDYSRRGVGGLCRRLVSEVLLLLLYSHRGWRLPCGGGGEGPRRERHRYKREKETIN